MPAATLSAPLVANAAYAAYAAGSPRKRLRLLLAGPAVALSLVLLMLWGCVCWFLIAYPQQLIAEQRRDLASAAKVAALQTEAVLRDAETSLRAVDLWLLNRGNSNPLDDVGTAQFADTLRETTRHLVDVLLVDDDGRAYRIPSLSERWRIDISQTPLFMQPQPHARLVLGLPLQLHEGGLWYLPLLMRLSAPAGPLVKAVALIDLQQLTLMQQHFVRGADSAVALIRSDGVAIAREPFLPGIAGLDVFAHAPERRREFAAAEGFLSGSFMGGIPRLRAFKEVKGFDVKVLVAKGEAATLADYRRQRTTVLALSSGISALALLITFSLMRRQRAAHLRDAMLTAIFDLTPDYVCQMDLHGRFSYLNPTARARLGFAPDEPLDSMKLETYYSPQGLERFQTEILPHALSTGHWQGRSSVRDSQGVEVPVDSTVLLHRDRAGRPKMISVILRDISAAIQERRKSQRFEAMLLAVAQTAPVMIAVMDPQQRYIFFNEAFCQHQDVRREVWIGRHMRELMGEADYAQRREHIEAALAGETRTIERRFQDDCGDGEGEPPAPMIIELQYAPLLTEEGEIEGVISISRDVSEARLEEERLREASQTDPLTHLLNRAGFATGCEIELAKARAAGSLLGLLYLDLDKFKPVNDEHGHPVGDALLEAVAGRLRNAVRSEDLVARLGGDEFAVMLSGVSSRDQVEALAAKLVAALCQPFRVEALRLQISVSIGYCVARADGADLAMLEAQADAQLYEAKRAGRACFKGVML